MIEYAQTVLPNVSDNPELFAKELKKCVDWSEEAELAELQRWAIANFGVIYPVVLKRIFLKKAA